VIEPSALPAFLYRAVTVRKRVSDMEEGGMLRQPPAPGSQAAAEPGTVLDAFDSEARARAKRMGRIYELLFCLENSVRELIESTFKEAKDLNDWTDGIDPGILQAARNREDQDRALPWHGPRGESILNYMDFPQLGQIILDRWGDFEDLLGDRTWVENYFREMNPTRRALAHTGDLTELDVERMELRVREWLTVVG
jgi:hypothetical protein